MTDIIAQQQTPHERADFIFYDLPEWIIRSLGDTLDYPPDLKVSLQEACEYKGRWYRPIVSCLIRLRLVADKEHFMLAQTERIYKELCSLVDLNLDKWPEEIPHTTTLCLALTIANVRDVMIWRATEVLRLKAEYAAGRGSDPKVRLMHERLNYRIELQQRQFDDAYTLFLKYGGRESPRWIFDKAREVPVTCRVAVT